MSQFDDFADFLRMDPDEREEHITDLLASVAEVWIDDDSESIMVRGMISSMRAFLDSVNEFARHMENGGQPPNKFIGGLFMHAYTQQTKNFIALSGLTDVKKSLKKGGS